VVSGQWAEVLPLIIGHWSPTTDFYGKSSTKEKDL
jgi:hypothetical protein